MFSIVRNGPKFLMISMNEEDKIKEYFIEKLEAISCDMDNVIECAQEGDTIVLLTNKIKDVIGKKELENILIIKKKTEEVLCMLINDNMNKYIKNIRTSPEIILMRSFGNIEKIIESIKKDYKVIEGNLIDLWEMSNNKSSLLAFTQKPLNKLTLSNDIYEKSLFIEMDSLDLFKCLRINALRYLNEGLDNKDWYEVEIRIYDRYGEYDLHYERLIKVLEILQIGIILGQSWAKDYPRLFMEVGVYRVRFFTFFEPKDIKKILVGLEFLEDGTRIIDYDIYCNRRKINWTDINYEKVRGKNILGEKYRKEIFSKLDEKEKEQILQLENEILKTRY